MFLVPVASTLGWPLPSWIQPGPDVNVTGGAVAALATVAMPFVGFWLLPHVRFTFDRRSGRFVEEHGVWRLPWRRVAELPLDEIEGARVLVHTDADGETYGVELVLVDGGTRSLLPTDDDRAEKEEIALRIRAFIDAGREAPPTRDPR